MATTFLFAEAEGSTYNIVESLCLPPEGGGVGGSSILSLLLSGASFGGVLLTKSEVIVANSQFKNSLKC